MRQKARVQWHLKGDRNSKFYHQAIQRRNHANGIKGIMVGNSWFTKVSDIKKVFFDHFKGFFSDDKKSNLLSIGALNLNRLNLEDSSWLERGFSMEELEWALNQMANEKAPGPDGFNVGCLKKFWPNIKDKVLACFTDFSTGLPFPIGLNSFIGSVFLKSLLK